MKSLICHIAQRRVDPKHLQEGWLSRHVDSCGECQKYLEGVVAIEENLNSSPPEHDSKMCRDIMASVRKVDLAEVAELPSPGMTPWGMRAGLAILFVVGCAVIALWNPADESAVVEDEPAVEDEPPREAIQENPAQVLATLFQQQELLRRDARKLGMHLQERVILFKPAN